MSLPFPSIFISSPFISNSISTPFASLVSKPLIDFFISTILILRKYLLIKSEGFLPKLSMISLGFKSLSYDISRSVSFASSCCDF